MANIRRSENERGLARTRGWDPFEMMQEIMGIDPLQGLSRGVFGYPTGFVPSFEVRETKDSFIFQADLPGVKQEELNISLSGNRLAISGQRQEEKRNEEDRYFAYERSYGSFSRSFTLPDGADPDHVQAELKDGVLTVVVPKKPEVQPKTIPIRASSGESQSAKDRAKA